MNMYTNRYIVFQVVQCPDVLRMLVFSHSIVDSNYCSHWELLVGLGNIEHFCIWTPKLQKMRTIPLVCTCETIPSLEIFKTQLDMGLSNLL